MITVYVIESFTDGTWYTGMAKDVIQRLKEHNNGKNRFTKGHLPWKIIYTEQLPDWSTARAREKYLKSASGKIWLKNNYPFYKIDASLSRRNHGVPCPTASRRQGFPYALQGNCKVV